mgnify:CR=1 FL=1
MSNDEWEQDEPPTNILGKIGHLLFPKKKKSKKTKEEPVETVSPPTTEVANVVPTTPEVTPEPQPEPIKEDKKSKKHKKKEKSDEDWVEDEKPKKQTIEPDLSRGLPGSLWIKRAIATILFLVYGILLVYVVKFETFSTIICITTLIILLDYLAITRGKTEQWG